MGYRMDGATCDSFFSNPNGLCHRRHLQREHRLPPVRGGRLRVLSTGIGVDRSDWEGVKRGDTRGPMSVVEHLGECACLGALFA